jgi:hypothetical protein
MTGQPENQQAAGARLPPEESLQPAVEAAIEKLMARQAADMRVVGAEMQERLAATLQRDGVRSPQPPIEPLPPPPAEELHSGADTPSAAERPRADSRRRSAIAIALLLLLLLAGIAGAGYRLVSDRRVQHGSLVAEPQALTATAVPATKTSIIAAPAVAPPTEAPSNIAPSATILAATHVPTSAAAAMSVATSVIATATPLPTQVPTVGTATTRSASTPTPATATDVPQRLIAAEGALRRGQMEAVLDYGNGVRATATLVFDYGGANQPQRLHLTTVYTSPTGSQTSEHIIVGNRAWDRQPDGRWVAVPEQEGVWGRVQPFLPHADQAPTPALRNEVGATSLRWTDAGQDITVLLDPASGIPQELRQVNRSTGATLVVTYRGWDTPVDIAPPTGT